MLYCLLMMYKTIRAEELVAQSIREQFAREAADKIDGVVTFQSGAKPIPLPVKAVRKYRSQ